MVPLSCLLVMLLISISRSSFPRGTSHNVHAATSAVRYIDVFEPSRQRYFPAYSYVAVSQIHVYMGTVRIQDTLKEIPMVARVSLTDYRGRILLDTLVRPTHQVENYRTDETGFSPSTFMGAPTLQEVQTRVSSIIRDKIIVGHCLWDFLSVLGLTHPAIATRDLALFLPLRQKLKSRTIVQLALLVNFFMGRNIGLQYEDSLETARAVIDLFRSCEDVFERCIRSGEWPCELPPSTYAEYFT
ncbi:uncharacterized protein BT62DRAFT_927543 [Guyanagaster necrorhizus]|uniref:Exonuclease domain-containing protein n=1 Tax=Guyanagaster necrorhizus TaxID=856835 RepID=A0A9P8AW55_9AGAR|nr:uncharacterized protein BT62DRAFT_927543 [Guyanagaster necrorhizus MCA 3950]KAG7450228.1 hypothetical protein BT62DRAFT_927543 [Guyanagaster necrorhizus MCA 3950]